MNSETLVTLLLSVLAITFGIINARQKKRNATVAPPVRPDIHYTEEPKPRQEQTFQASRPTIEGNTLPEEAQPATSPNEIAKTHYGEKTVTNKKKYGFNAKEAVLYSEILKPKFDEFG